MKRGFTLLLPLLLMACSQEETATPTFSMKPVIKSFTDWSTAAQHRDATTMYELSLINSDFYNMTKECEEQWMYVPYWYYYFNNIELVNKLSDVRVEVKGDVDKVITVYGNRTTSLGYFTASTKYDESKDKWILVDFASDL